MFGFAECGGSVQVHCNNSTWMRHTTLPQRESRQILLQLPVERDWKWTVNSYSCQVYQEQDEQ